MTRTQSLPCHRTQPGMNFVPHRRFLFMGRRWGIQNIADPVQIGTQPYVPQLRRASILCPSRADETADDGSEQTTHKAPCSSGSSSSQVNTGLAWRVSGGADCDPVKAPRRSPKPIPLPTCELRPALTSSWVIDPSGSAMKSLSSFGLNRQRIHRAVQAGSPPPRSGKPRCR